MISEIVTTAVGLVSGFATGLYFERRATKAARAESDALRVELHHLRSSVLTVGGRFPTSPTAHTEKAIDPQSLLMWLRLVQDPSGSLPKRQAVAHLLDRGASQADAERLLAGLELEGSIVLEGAEIRVLPR